MKKINKSYSAGLSFSGGFTLMELLVVVLIIGILASVALPQYQVAVAKSRYTKGRVLVDALWNAQQAYYMANGAYATNLENLDIDLPAGMQHTFSASEGAGDEIWENKDFRVLVGPSHMYMALKNTGEDFGPQYLRYFDVKRPALCYARTPSVLWNKVCKSLGGTINHSTGFWNTYNLP